MESVIADVVFTRCWCAGHEAEKRVYDWSSESHNLGRFIALAAEYGLFVYLRVGPFVCSEWTVSYHLPSREGHRRTHVLDHLLTTACCCVALLWAVWRDSAVAP